MAPDAFPILPPSSLFPYASMSSSSTSSSTIPQKCSDLWYPDGTVVLKAENTLFCVYSGFLSQRSVVFNDILRLSPADTFQDLPVVSILATSEHAFHFLKSIYDHQYFEKQVLQNISLMMAVLPLSAKYKIDYLQQALVTKFLEQHGPTTLAAYRKRGNVNPLRHIEIANSARASGVTILLPLALYECCRLWDEDALFRSKLNAENTRLAVVARPKLAKAVRTKAHRFVFSPTAADVQACCSPTKCRVALASIVEDIDDVGPDLFWAPDWSKLGDFVCDSCVARWRKSATSAGNELWNELPSFFGLPSWNQLRKQSVSSRD